MTEALLEKIWEKGYVVEGIDENLFRKDTCGAWIAHTKYDDTSNEFGWKIDHIYPVQLGGDENIINLRPMNWKNIESKATDYPSYYSAVIADKCTNIEHKELFYVNKSLQAKLDKLYGNY